MSFLTRLRPLALACCALIALTAGGLAAQTADLSLALAQPDEAPARYTVYEVTATLTNAGPSSAADVRVALPLPEGVVFEGGNEYVASRGRFSPNGSRAWTIPLLGATETATLTLRLFLLDADAPAYYGQVVASGAADPDSEPANGTPGLVLEDDEASTDPGAVPPCSVTARVIDLDVGCERGLYTATVEVGNASGLGRWEAVSGTSARTGTGLDTLTFDGSVEGLLAGRTPGGVSVSDPGNPRCSADASWGAAVEAACTGGEASGADLALALELPLQIRPFTDYQAVVTLVNDGPEAATGVVVSVPFAQGEGAVFRGSGAFTATQGSYSPYGKQRWTVGELAAGDTAALVLNLYRLDGELPEQYAQVAASEVDDPDSTPGNGVPGEVREDDEATSVPTPVRLPNLRPDSIAFDVPPSEVGGGEVSFSVYGTNDSEIDLPSSFAIDVYVSADAVLDAGDVLADGGRESPLRAGRQFRWYGDFDGGDLAPGDYYLIAELDVNGEIPERDEGDNVIAVPFTLGSGGMSGFADLSLAVERDPDPGAFEGFGGRVLVFNDGPAAASRVVVSVPFAQGAGAVFSGEFAYDADRGRYSAYGDQEWYIGTLRAGDTAVLDLNFYRLEGELPELYAQVIGSDQDDPDSTPGNGVPPAVNEDDEASTVGGTGGECNFPVVFAGLIPPDGLTAQSRIDGRADGGFTVTQYAYSPDENGSLFGDLAAVARFDYSAEGAVVQAPSSFTDTIALSDGEDAPELDVVEIDRSTETFTVAFEGDASRAWRFPLNLPADSIELGLGAFRLDDDEYFVFGKAIFLEGGVRTAATWVGYRISLAGEGQLLGSGFFGTFAEFYESWTLDEFELAPNGDVVFAALSSLDYRLDLFRVSPEVQLVYQTDLPVTRGFVSGFILRDDGTSVLRILSYDAQEVVVVSPDGSVTSLPRGASFPGRAQIERFLEGPDGGYALLRTYRGSSLTSVVQVYDSEDRLRYERAFPSADLEALGAAPDVFDTPQLRDLAEDGTLYFSTDAAAGGTLILRLDPDGSLGCAEEALPQYVDLELDVTASDFSPEVNSVVSVITTVTNRGTIPATGVRVGVNQASDAFDGPDPEPELGQVVVRVGGDERSTSQGAYPLYGGDWDVGTLAPGATATLTENYFVRRAGRFEVAGFVLAQDQADLDSEPGPPGQLRSAWEDDTDDVFVTTRARAALRVRPGALTVGAAATVSLSGVVDAGPAELVVADLSGRAVVRRPVDLLAGDNRLELPTDGLAPGVYVVAAPATEAAPVKLVVR